MAEVYPTVLHRWFEEVWNQRREDAISELMHPDAVAHGLTDDKGNELVGPAAFRPLYDAFTRAFPDIRFTIEDHISERDRIAAICTVTGTHTGEGIGVDPTKKPINITGLCMVRVGDGKIAESWNQFDFMAMYQQIGVLSLTLT